MLAPVRNLAMITIGILICLSFTWVALRGHAMNKPLAEPSHHPFLADLPATQPSWIAFRGIRGFAENTLASFDEALKVDPKAILWADIRPTGDGNLVLFHDLELSAQTDGKGWIGFTTLAEIAKLNAGFHFKDESGHNPYLEHPVRISTLAEFLEHFPTQRLILNICDNRPGLEEKLIEVVDTHTAGNRLLIQSDQEGLLKDLREKKPEWLFGNSQVRSTQLRMLAAIGLAPVAPLKGDVYVTEVEIDGNNMLTPGMLEEIHRRKLAIFAGPVTTPAAIKTLVQSGVQGVITPDPQLLK